MFFQFNKKLFSALADLMVSIPSIASVIILWTFPCSIISLSTNLFIVCEFIILKKAIKESYYCQ